MKQDHPQTVEEKLEIIQKVQNLLATIQTEGRDASEEIGFTFTVNHGNDGSTLMYGDLPTMLTHLSVIITEIMEKVEPNSEQEKSLANTVRAIASSYTGGTEIAKES